MKILLGLLCLILCAACTPSPQTVDTLPTLAQIDAQSPSTTVTEEPLGGPPTLPPSFTPAPTQTNAATFTRIPTLTPTRTPIPTPTTLSHSVAPEGTPFPTTTVGAFWLEGGADFSNVGTSHADGRYLLAIEGMENVSELLWSKGMQINQDRIYSVYFRVRFPSDLTPGTYAFSNEQEANPAENVTALFFYADCCAETDIVFNQQQSGRITFSATGESVSAQFNYMASDGTHTLTLNGGVENARGE